MVRSGRVIIQMPAMMVSAPSAKARIPLPKEPAWNAKTRRAIPAAIRKIAIMVATTPPENIGDIIAKTPRIEVTIPKIISMVAFDLSESVISPKTEVSFIHSSSFG
jgi:hypothetical protein